MIAPHIKSTIINKAYVTFLFFKVFTLIGWFQCLSSINGLEFADDSQLDSENFFKNKHIVLIFCKFNQFIFLVLLTYKKETKFDSKIKKLNYFSV